MAKRRHGLHRRNRATTSDEVRTVNFGTMTSPLAHLGRSSLDVSRKKVGRIAEAKSCGSTRSTAESSTTLLKKFLKLAPKRTLPLVEDVEIDGTLVAYSNECFVQGVEHHRVSQLLAAVMDRWPSFTRFGSTKLTEVPPMSGGVAATHTSGLLTWNDSTSLGRNCRTTHPS